jgi:prevent-host-death family protein
VADTYSTYEAKARFSEIIRKVRAGRRVVVTHHGVEVAEIRPLDRSPETLAERLESLARDGRVARAAGAPGVRLIARRPGALARFLADRE